MSRQCTLALPLVLARKPEDDQDIYGDAVSMRYWRRLVATYDIEAAAWVSLCACCTGNPTYGSCLRQVAAGSDLFISVWNLHRSPAIWERPNDFLPDRFPVDDPTPTEVTHNFAYLPFGGGRRKCIGALSQGCHTQGDHVRYAHVTMVPLAGPHVQVKLFRCNDTFLL